VLKSAREVDSQTDISTHTHTHTQRERERERTGVLIGGYIYDQDGMYRLGLSTVNDTMRLIET